MTVEMRITLSTEDYDILRKAASLLETIIEKTDNYAGIPVNRLAEEAKDNIEKLLMFDEEYIEM